MVVAPRPAEVPVGGFVTGDWIARFEARSFNDICAFGRNSPEDDRLRRRGAGLSELNLSAYRTMMQPWARMLSNQPMADIAKALNPLRLSYTMLADSNPWMKGVHDPGRRRDKVPPVPIATDNRFLALQTHISGQIVASLDAYRMARDRVAEQASGTRVASAAAACSCFL